LLFVDGTIIFKYKSIVLIFTFTNWPFFGTSILTGVVPIFSFWEQ